MPGLDVGGVRVEPVSRREPNNGVSVFRSDDQVMTDAL